MALILTFIPMLYLFAALPELRRRAADDKKGITGIHGGIFGCGLASGLGIATTLLTITTSLVPPQHSTNPGLFFVKGFG